MAYVDVKGVRKRYGEMPVLRDVNFTAERGTATVLLGRSGSGKSTLLRCLNGLESFEAGEIRIGDMTVSREPGRLRALRQRVGIVFQSFNLFPHLTVERNITLALRCVKRLPREECCAQAEVALRQVGLLDRIHAYPDELSGGQQQRVAIARSLAMQPEVMLFDEVTSALDPELKGEVLRVMRALGESGMTMLLVTHEMRFARDVADTVIFMHAGKVHENGSPEELFDNPATPELRQFLSAQL